MHRDALEGDLDLQPPRPVQNTSSKVGAGSFSERKYSSSFNSHSGLEHPLLMNQSVPNRQNNPVQGWVIDQAGWASALGYLTTRVLELRES